MASAMEQQGEKPAAGAEDCGEVRDEPQAAGESIEDRIRLLLRLRAQTKQQLLEYKSMIDASEEKTPEQIMQEKQIEVKIEDLENEIEDVKSSFEVKSLALNRMKLSAALTNNIEKMGTESSVLTDDMKHIIKLHKLIMKSQEESSELEEKLLGIRKKRLQLKIMVSCASTCRKACTLKAWAQGSGGQVIFYSELKDNLGYMRAYLKKNYNEYILSVKKSNDRENYKLKQTSRSKLLEIQTEKSKQKKDLDNMENSEVIKTMQKKLQMEIKITTVIQHVFQGLILGSKTNWAEDSALREIVLQLEKDLTTI